jgi:hypothetical protein
LHQLLDHIVKNFAALGVFLDNGPQGNGQGDPYHYYLIICQLGDHIEQFLFEYLEFVEIPHHKGEGLPLDVLFTQAVAFD